MRLVTSMAAIGAIIAALASTGASAQSGGAQPAAPRPAPPAAEKEAAAKAEARPARKRMALADVDARHCLKFETNLQIHRCAEKYRPR